MTLPESVKGRISHSLTATCLGPGLTEVLLFGGWLTLEDHTAIAETTILRFGEQGFNVLLVQVYVYHWFIVLILLYRMPTWCQTVDSSGCG